MTSDIPPATVMRALGLDECALGLVQHWESSGKTFVRSPFFLRAAFIEEASSKCGIAPFERENLLRAATTIMSNEALVRLMWHQHHLLFADAPVDDMSAVMLPEHVEALGQTNTYNLLLAFSGLPKAEKALARFPRDVLKGVCEDIGIWCSYFRRSLDTCGITPRILLWERGLMHGAFYRIGRLQFGIRPFHPNYHVYRDRTSGAVRALVRSGVAVNADGQLDGVDGHHDAQAWTTTFEQNAVRVTGYPLSPRGFVMREPVTQELSAWEEVLAPGDPILDVHVPADGPLDIDRCADAFRRAIVFFRTNFPEKPFHGFSCCAWFLDIQFEKLLPPTSNILRFQRGLYLYPVAAGGRESLRSIFGERGLQNGLAMAPRTNSMQRAVVAHLDAGGRLRSGGGFILTDDLPFGRPVYRSSESSQTDDTMCFDRPSIIYDNDMGNDIDDAFAQAMVATSHSLGNVRLVLSLSSNTNLWSVAANDALNRFYGVTDCPVGLYRGDVKVAGDHRGICKRMCGGRPVAADRILDGVCALRKVLAEARDGSVRIVATGFASNLAGLLATEANHQEDGIPHSGLELATSKVQFLAIMACDFNAVHTRINPLAEFNVAGDIPSMRRLMAEWPTRVVISDFLIGQLAPLAWTRLEERLPANHPLLLGYRQYYDPDNGGCMGDRPSWDLTAMLYALEPEGDHFGLSDPGEVTIREDGVSVFIPCAAGRRQHLLLDAAHPPARVLDALHARIAQRTWNSRMTDDHPAGENSNAGSPC